MLSEEALSKAKVSEKIKEVLILFMRANLDKHGKAMQKSSNLPPSERELYLKGLSSTLAKRLNVGVSTAFSIMHPETILILVKDDEKHFSTYNYIISQLRDEIKEAFNEDVSLD